MLIEGIVAGAVVVVVLAVVVLTRRVSHDDVHSVERYYRSLHTLEHINARPAGPDRDAASGASGPVAHAEGGVRQGGSPAVRVTDPRPSPAPPAPRPLETDTEVPLTFDDADLAPVVPTELSNGGRDKAIIAMNHRPRRLLAPALAIAAVLVLVLVLVLTGMHAAAPRHHRDAASTGTRSPTSSSKSPGQSEGHQSKGQQTLTTSPPAVSLPQSSTPRGATYEVTASDYTLALAATSGACWVDATNTASGTTLFTGTLKPGAPQTLDVSGPVTVLVGAPTVFVASVDGTAVSLPAGFQTPFTMSFVTAAAPAS